METNGARFVKMLAWLPQQSNGLPTDRERSEGELMELGKGGEIKFGHADNDEGNGLGRWPINYLGLIKRATTIEAAKLDRARHFELALLMQV